MSSASATETPEQQLERGFRDALERGRLRGHRDRAHRPAGFAGTISRVTSRDSFVPLGEAANHVLLQEAEIETAARALVAV